MNQVLEYIYNHPKEKNRIIGITDKQQGYFILDIGNKFTGF